MQGIRDAQFLDIIECPPGLTRSSEISCRRVHASADEVICETSLASREISPSGRNIERMQANYKALVLLRGTDRYPLDELPGFPVKLDELDSRPMDTAEVLEWYQDRTDLRGRYRVIEDLNGTSSEAIRGRMIYREIQDFAGPRQTRYQYSPYLLEALMQVVNFYIVMRDPSQKRSMIPHRIGDMQFLRKCTHGESITIEARMQDRNEEGISWNARVSGSAGKSCDASQEYYDAVVFQMISVQSLASKHKADSKAAEHPETGRQGRRPYHEPGKAGVSRLLQDSLNDQDRSTNTLTLGPSPRGREKCKTALGLLPLPLGEDWGEGVGIATTLNRGTRGTLCRVLRELLRAGHQLSGERFPGPNATQHQTPLALRFLGRNAEVVCGCISLSYFKWNRNQRDWAKQAAVSALLTSVSDAQEGLCCETKPGVFGIEIVSDSLGKPHLLIDGSEGPSVSFAYEGHTMWVAVGRRGSNVGIDAAQSASFMGNYPFHRVFQEGELGNGGKREEAAALIWSAKEAVVKALGCGFHLVDPLHLRVEKSSGDHEASLLKVYLTDKARERCQLQAKDPVPVWILRHSGMWVSVASVG